LAKLAKLNGDGDAESPYTIARSFTVR